MFAKPYKQKSNNTLKNSEKKHLAQRILDEFPGVTEEKVKELVPVKSSTSCMKLVLHSGETVGVYVVDGVPMVMETEEALMPTVCALWKVPELLPTLIIHSPVLPKMLGGAPLYLPGVVRGARRRFARGALLAACTQDNAAAAAVGRATISLQDMQYMAAGVCMEPIHVSGDLLCKEPKFAKIERPKLGPASYPGDPVDTLVTDINQLSIQPPLKEEWPSLVRAGPASVPAHAHAPRVIPEPAPAQTADDTDDNLDDTALTEDSQMEEEGDKIPSDMDGLLRWCLLSFLKLDGKHVELPLKTNLLYKNHLMPLCPPDRTLDVKKSSYKKMGKFLEAMQQEGLLEVREIDKGVDAVVAVQPAHAQVRGHAPPPRPEPPSEPNEYTPPVIREMFCVTANVAALFPEHRKGTPLTAADIRNTVTEYVRARNLAPSPRQVQLDAALAAVLGRREQDVMKWDEVILGVQGRFTPSTEMRFADGGARLSKSRLEPVSMSVATRSGNKKVTLVSNLEAFGFNLQALAHVCQQGVAAACGVTRSPAAKHDQLMLQGDQTYYVAKLLIEKYGLPKKFVDGADKALKKKK